MLYTDRDWVTIDDITTIDPDVLDVATVENIPTEGQSSFVHRAIEECANKLLSDFQGFPNYYAIEALAGTIGAMGALNDSTPPPRIIIGQIVVDSTTTTYWSPLKQFVTYLALRNFYQIASNRKIDDRYQVKLQQVECDLDHKYYPTLKKSGLPIVFTPVPCPGAQYELTSGVWTDSNVTQASGGSGSGNVWDVAITWTSSQSGNVESGPSQTITISVDADHVISVDVSSLKPPDQSYNYPQSGTTNVFQWNIYAGVQGGPLYLQASVPIATKTYTLSADPVLTGTLMGRGQNADTSLVFLNGFFRG